MNAHIRSNSFVLNARRAWRNHQARSHISCNGELLLDAPGEIRGYLRLGTNYGKTTLAPTILYVGGYLSAEAELFGDNTIWVERGARMFIFARTRINTGARIYCKSQIMIERDCLISSDVWIRDNDGHNINGIEGVAPIHIGKHVWICHGAIILKGVHIGDGSIIGAGSVVTHNIPEHSMAVGNPAWVVKNGVEWSD